jgi:putative (di)nucleoside polyphosphate hydrolase
VIDSDGYRLNVGIILKNPEGRLLWARRIGQDAWQFPQGGIAEQESLEEAMYRELHEEVGLEPRHVSIQAISSDWLRYRLPKRLIRHSVKPLCVGQKQRWFLLNMDCDDSQVRFDCCGAPEFDHWRWVSYWRPVREVVPFKRRVYARVLREFAPLVLG